LVGEKSNMQDEIILTPDYWDCECVNNFIHSKEKSFCKVCGSFADEQPESRVNEVKDWLEVQYRDVLFLIEKMDCFGKVDIAELSRIKQELGKLQELSAEQNH
jgi:threonine synthase